MSDSLSSRAYPRTWVPLVAFTTRRLALAVVTLLLVSVIVFAATQALPGDAAQAILGRGATPDRVVALREQLGLNRPVFGQYLSWMGGVLHGDLGDSLATRNQVVDLIKPRMINTGVLLVIVAIVAIPLALLLGAWSAVRRDKLVDRIVTGASLLLTSLPAFVLAIGLVLTFATSVFKVLPAVSLIPPGDNLAQHLDVLVLPVIALSLAVMPYIILITRGSMVEVLLSDYVEMARLNGIPERRVVLRHALPNGLVPAIQVTALQLAWLAGGIVVVEYVFQFNGLGGALVDAVANRDVPVVQAITLLMAATYVTLNLLADLGTLLVTPRLRRGLGTRAAQAALQETMVETVAKPGGVA